MTCVLIKERQKEIWYTETQQKEGNREIEAEIGVSINQGRPRILGVTRNQERDTTQILPVMINFIGQHSWTVGFPLI